MPIKLISTDFDGTIFAEFENPPIPSALQNLIGALQRRGVSWVINTGRELGSLLETLARAQTTVHPDALVLVEREIYVRRDDSYVPIQSWNQACTRDHQELFGRIAPELPELLERLKTANPATFYEDAFSPLCVLAETTPGADAIQRELERYARAVPHLAVVRNDVYIRLAHGSYDKGRALAEIARRLKASPMETLAAGDHYNDLPMLRPELARWLVAPANAIQEVQNQVRNAGGYISSQPHGEGVTQGIEFMLEQASDTR
jgi:HAD superfamily hydrolase (TIGR01484 family)